MTIPPVVPIGLPSSQTLRHTSEYDHAPLSAYSLTTIYKQRKDVISAIHATDKSEAWKECNGLVGSHMRNEKSASSITLLPQLLGQLEILLFSGDQDWICNYAGTEKLIANLNWNGEQGLGVRRTLVKKYLHCSCVL